MLDDFQCPLCAADQWEPVGRHVFESKDHAPGGAFANDRYVTMRRRVLFEVWFPGADRVELTTQFCRACGFFCYRPRPSAEDIEAKYRFLTDREVHMGASTSPSEQAVRLNQHRAQVMMRRVLSGLETTGQAVLDVGGGDGGLMEPFLRAGCDCSLVDYNPQPRPGVRRLGNTLQDIPAGSHFDIITCSHVLEHVADPMELLVDMSRVLRPKGRLYVEVPLELWKGIPIEREPVTHVNFYNDESLAFALRRAGYRILSSGPAVGSYGNSRILIAWAVGTPDDGANTAQPPGDSATRRLVYPDMAGLLKRAAWIEPQLERSLAPLFRLPATVLRKLIKR